MKYPSKGFEPLRDAGTALVGTDLDADDYTEWYDLDDADKVGFAIAIGTVTGTSPTLDISFQCRFGGGSNIWEFPLADSNETISGTAEAKLTQMDTSNTNGLIVLPNPLPSGGKGGQIRAFFNTGGTNPVFPVQECYFWKVERGA